MVDFTIKSGWASRSLSYSCCYKYVERYRLAIMLPLHNKATEAVKKNQTCIFTSSLTPEIPVDNIS